MFVLAFAESPIQLLPDGSLLIHIAMILAMIWILNRTFFRPINKIIATREKSKGGSSSEATGILKEVAEKKSEYTEVLQTARSEGYELIEKQRNDALAQKKTKVDSAKEDIAKMRETEKAEMEKQVGEAKAAIVDEAENMAEQIRSNLLDAA